MSIFQKQKKEIFEEKSKKELDLLIEKAFQKLNIREISTLCYFLPAEKEKNGKIERIHHLTFRKISKENPHKLYLLIKKYVIEKDSPKPFPKRTRSPRKMKNSSTVILDREVAREIADFLQNSSKEGGEQENVVSGLLSKLTPPKTLVDYKRELIEMIKKEEADEEIWRRYANCIAKSKRNSDYALSEYQLNTEDSF